MYWYISILPPTDENTLCDTNRLIGFLEEQPELKRTNDVTFASAEGQPWIDITIVKGTADGNWSSGGELISQFNRVEIVCADHPQRDFYVEISTKIADFLQWRYVTEGDV
ncbi:MULTISPECIES: hypothetical protein [Rhizobium/Agrobacterium group]|uniref:hypothetical protein n=1 Tax=Rhizobium/Agrobacterium group TaxID=227290 RepID=UPI000FDBF453|nr:MULTISPECIES: hypothetical protein [Rhizobium/Agrobacterium group]MBB4399481.1 hypothetical protein [Agrobacterium radiobacter]MBB5585635.1 hypothetical protein [Agrobacterium radiobacter]RVT75573.1 hypothetical protein EM858_14020 [Agrobacterium sp. CNPSo 2736]TGE92510.1 hypothetical protein C9418_05840 [Rhizobium sp. SEMIA 4032]